jgi:hypothetical protein
MKSPLVSSFSLVLATAGALFLGGCGGGGSGDPTSPSAAASEDNAELQPKSESESTAAAETKASGARLVRHEVTFYGWPDNSPPGPAISSPQVHDQAGGTGTYDDPVTFAASPDAFAPGTILYVPYLKKYVIMEDRCAACVSDWNRGERHIDVWMNSTASNASALRDCQRAFTRSSAEVELDPPGNRPVDSAPLFDPATGSCRL